jgi:hypothetical protein
MTRTLAIVLTLLATWAAAAEEPKDAPASPLAEAAPQGGAPAAGRALIVADEWAPMDVLAGFLRARGKFAVEKAEQNALPPDLAAYRTVFMYIHSRMHEPCEKALVAYATGGGRLVILHHGIASARRLNPAWLRLTGIAIPPRDHPEHPWRVIGNTTHTLVNLAPGHFITTHGITYDREVAYTSPTEPKRRGRFPAIDLEKTEVFLNQQFTDGQAKTVLFGFRCTDPGTGKVIMQDTSGWLKRAGAGWVFYFQPGHSASDFADERYAQIVLNAVLWKPAADASGAEKP